MSKYALFLAEGVSGCPYHYLAATTRVNMVGKSYKGSGRAWKDHLAVCDLHNYYYVHKTDSYAEHQQVAKELSDLLNIVKDDKFLNMVSEEGVSSRVAMDLSNAEVKSLYRSQKKEIALLEDVKDYNGEKIFNSLECCDDTYNGEEKMLNDIYNNQIIEEIEWLKEDYSAIDLELLKLRFLDKKTRKEIAIERGINPTGEYLTPFGKLLIPEIQKRSNRYINIYLRRKEEVSLEYIKKWIKYESSNK